MRRKTQLLVCFFIASVEVAYCFSQTSGHNIQIRADGRSSRLDESTSELLNSEPVVVLHNLCLPEKPDEDQSETYVVRGNSTWQNTDSSIDTSQTSKNRKYSPGKLISNDTSSHRFSSHFVSCTHIGIEPGIFELLRNGSIHVPELSLTFDESEFCMNEDGMVFICDERLSNSDKNDTSPEEQANLYAYLSEEFLNCSGHIAIEIGSFEIRPNRSAYVPSYDRVFDYSNHLIGEDGQLYICPEFFPKSQKFTGPFGTVTVLGLSISILFIILYMGFFAFMESLRNLPGYCLFSLCLALLNAYTCFLIRSIKPNSDVCRNLVLSIMYFFLAAFFWMNVLSFDVWRSLKMATSKLRLSSNSMMWKRFALYSLYAWLSPLAIVLFSILVTEYKGAAEFLHLEFDEDLCWFAKKGALFAYLALPLLILMCLNGIFFTHSFIMITRASMNSTDNMATFWKRFSLFLKLAVIMGVAWIFGIIAAATNQVFLFYIFVILNTLQGVFIFFSFAISEKTKKVLKKKMGTRKTSVFPSQVTSQPAQSVTSF